MSETIVVGLDGHASGERALEYAKRMANLIGDSELVLVYVIEWSPYSFQTAQENAERHNRREQEINTALERVINPALENLKKANLNANGIVRHGDVADTLNAIANENDAQQIIVARSSEGGFSKRIFGSSTTNLVMSADVPVTVIK